MGEIDARAKNALAAIFLVVHRDPAHDGDLGRWVERRHIDGEFGLSQGRVVLGVEEARIGHVEMDGLAASREARGPKIERAARGEFGAKRGAFRSRQQHGVTEMLADARARQHVGEKQALVDLDAVLVALAVSGFGADFLPGRDQSRNKRGRGVGEIVEAAEGRGALGQEIVDPLDMQAEKRFARSARGRQQRIRGRLFGLVPPRLWRQLAKESRRLAPEGAVRASVGLILAGRGREGPGPFLHRLLGQAGGAHRREGGFRRRRHVLGLLSMTRFALPSDRSIPPGSATLTFALMPIRAFISCASSFAACARASSDSSGDRASTRTSNSSSRSSRVSMS